LLNVVDTPRGPGPVQYLRRRVSIGRHGATSYFSEGLVKAFESAAEDPEEITRGGTRWPVTSVTIKTSLDVFYDKQKIGAIGHAGRPGWAADSAISLRPPDVMCGIQINPQKIDGTCTITCATTTTLP